MPTLQPNTERNDLPERGHLWLAVSWAGAAVVAWLAGALAGGVAAMAGVLAVGAAHVVYERRARASMADAAKAKDAAAAEAAVEVVALQHAAGELLSLLRDIGEHDAEVLAGARQSQHSTSHAVEGAVKVHQGVETASASAASVSENVGLIVAALQPLTQHLGVVADGARETVQVTSDAEKQSVDSGAKMAELTNAASEIGQVVSTIHDVAEQTNLLALNATIEAARAGEAGKGFAVVASEVKELARQTSEATMDISLRVEAIQASSKLAVESTQTTREAVSKVGVAAESIAQSVAKQQGTVTDIHGRLDLAQADMEGLSDALAQITEAGNQVSTGLDDADCRVRESTQNIILTRHDDQDIRAAMAKIRACLDV